MSGARTRYLSCGCGWRQRVEAGASLFAVALIKDTHVLCGRMLGLNGTRNHAVTENTFATASVTLAIDTAALEAALRGAAGAGARFNHALSWEQIKAAERQAARRWWAATATDMWARYGWERPYGDPLGRWWAQGIRASAEAHKYAPGGYINAPARSD